MISTVLIAISDHWFHNPKDNNLDFMECGHQLWRMWYTRELGKPLLVVELEKMRRDTCGIADSITVETQDNDGSSQC